jgi:hypothetical protein
MLSIMLFRQQNLPVCLTIEGLRLSKAGFDRFKDPISSLPDQLKGIVEERAAQIVGVQPRHGAPTLEGCMLPANTTSSRDVPDDLGCRCR